MDNLQINEIERAPRGAYVYYTYTRDYGDEERLFEATTFLENTEITDEEIEKAIEDKLASEIA